jgi:hypothetical protein
MSQLPHSLLIAPTSGGLAAEVPLGELTLRIEVRGLRHERTGLHGTLYIYWANSSLIPLAWSYLNLDRDEDRGRLARKAYACLCQATGARPSDSAGAQQLVRLLDRLCLQVCLPTSRPNVPNPWSPKWER